MSKIIRDRRRKKNSKEQQGGLELSHFSIPPAEHEAYRDAIISAAEAGVADFPRKIEDLIDKFRCYDPLGIVATFSVYGLQGTVGADGASQTSVVKGIQQHHAELLQALMLTVPTEQWGRAPFTADITQAIFEAVPKIAETFLYQRALAMRQVEDKQKQAVLSLQDLIRFHTQGVRNWGYYSDVVHISSELYGSLDRGFVSHHGFGASDLIHILDSILSEFEHRINVRFKALQRISRGNNFRQVIRLYHRHVPQIQGDPEDTITKLPPTMTQKEALLFVLSHYNLSLPDLATFTVEDVAEFSARSPELVEKVLKSVSRSPGDLVGQNPEHLFLSNPVWAAPGIALANGFFFSMPQVAFSHIHDLMRRLAEEAGLKDELERARASYLERKIEEVLRVGLPKALIQTGVTWLSNGQQFETDALVILDRVVLIVEAKSHRLTPEGLRGAPDRVKRHIRELVLDPSIQSTRLESLIISARDGDTVSSAIVRSIGIDPTQVDHIARLSVTLDDFSILSSSEKNLKEIGWIPLDHQLAPTIGLADLVCLVDILDDPLLLLHYLLERSHFQKSFDVLGDELDFLGLYLKTGLNLGNLEKHEGQFIVTGMSEAIDLYYTSRDAKMNLAKPKAQIRPLFQSIIKQLSERRPKGWVTIGIHLLSCADFEEQKVLEKQIDMLKEIVKNNYRDPRHLNSLQIQPPQGRKARVIFYLYPRQLRAGRNEAIEQLAAEALADADCSACVVFGRCIDNWNLAYEVVASVSKAEDDDPSQHQVAPP